MRPFGIPITLFPAAFLTATLLMPTSLDAEQRDRWTLMRHRMVDEILKPGGISDERVLDAIRQTPRHLFVPRRLRNQSYFDMALPIGDQQTISSPFIVAYMTESVSPRDTDRVLEIGTGSGYQAAVLSPLVEHVYSIEIVEPLGRRAARTLRSVGLRNITTKIGDGFQGWAEHAPFDKIIVTCSPEDVPQTLVDQLREGGRMVIPVGERYQQTLHLFTKQNGKLKTERLRPTLFVPMTGLAEEDREIQPDPLRPTLVNSTFEAPPRENGFVSGWYYQRQARLVSDSDAPAGKNYIQFDNETPGREAHLMQGLAIDGRRIRKMAVRCWVKTSGIPYRPSTQEGAKVVLSFYDENRRELGLKWLGPWQGQENWQQQQKTITVPSATREMILRIGLFGSVGTAAFDNVIIDPL